MMQHLRKRQIVIVGSGMSVLAFCDRFRSEYAEITVVAEQTRTAPYEALCAIAAGRISAEKWTRSLPVRFGKRKDIRFVSQKPERIDLDERKLYFEGEQDPVEFDFLILGRESQTGSGPVEGIHDYGDALRVRKLLETLPTPRSIVVTGNDFQAVHTASMFSRSDIRVTLVNAGRETIASLDEKRQRRADFQIRQTGIHLFHNDHAEPPVDGSVSIGKQKVPGSLLIDTHFVEIPLVIRALGFEENEEGRICTRPDGRIPGRDRIYVFAELTDVVDALGRLIPRSESVQIQYARYLARILKGIIEVRRGYDVDCPAFLYRDRGDFATLNSTNSIGQWGKFFFKGPVGSLLERMLQRFPVFALNNGILDALRRITPFH